VRESLPGVVTFQCRANYHENWVFLGVHCDCDATGSLEGVGLSVRHLVSLPSRRMVTDGLPRAL
jgi:hypothetical protein